MKKTFTKADLLFAFKDGMAAGRASAKGYIAEENLEAAHVAVAKFIAKNGGVQSLWRWCGGSCVLDGDGTPVAHVVLR
jgi:ribosomal protein L16/L10AE